MKIFHTVLLAALLQVFWGVESWPDVPDPYGLGPRLALIDWLRENKVNVRADASDQELVNLYRDKTDTQDIDRRSAEATREAKARRAVLAKSFGRSDDARVSVAWIEDRIQERKPGQAGYVEVNGKVITQPDAAIERTMTADESRAVRAAATYSDSTLTIRLPAAWRVTLASGTPVGQVQRGDAGHVVTMELDPRTIDAGLTLHAISGDGAMRRTWRISRP